MFAKVTHLGTAVNSQANDQSASISGDGQFIFFDSTRPGGTGPADFPEIWVAARTGDTFGPAMNVNELAGAALINTPGTADATPYITPDWPRAGAKLYWLRATGLNDWDLHQATWVPVPEPSSLAITALGIIALLGSRGRFFTASTRRRNST
jgi:hypothetical protein